MQGQQTILSSREVPARPCHPRNYPWAELMKRLWEADVLECHRCRGHMKIMAVIRSLEAIRAGGFRHHAGTTVKQVTLTPGQNVLRGHPGYACRRSERQAVLRRQNSWCRGEGQTRSGARPLKVMHERSRGVQPDQLGLERHFDTLPQIGCSLPLRLVATEAGSCNGQRQ
jgi:hypothetical protein